MTEDMDAVAKAKVKSWLESFRPADGCAACAVPEPAPAPARPKVDLYVADGSGMYGAADRPVPGIDILVDEPEGSR